MLLVLIRIEVPNAQQSDIRKSINEIKVFVEPVLLSEKNVSFYE